MHAFTVCGKSIYLGMNVELADHTLKTIKAASNVLLQKNITPMHYTKIEHNTTAYSSTTM